MTNSRNIRKIRLLLLAGLLIALVFAFGFASTLAAEEHTHTYNGTPMPLDKIYTPDEVATVFGNAPASCLDESGKGAFTCDLCGNSFLVNLRGACQYEDDDVISFVDSTCSQVGIKTYECGVCEQERTALVPRKPHTYTKPPVTATPTGGTLTLTFQCDLCDAPENVVCTDWSVDSEMPSCARDYTDTYTYTYTDRNGLSQEGTLAVTHTKLAHYYDNGEPVEIDLNKTYTTSELKGIFGDSLTGLTTFGNVFTSCSTVGKAAFTCSGCDIPYLIAATGDHNWGAWVDMPADCLNAAYAYRECRAGDCDGYEKVMSGTEALGHDEQPHAAQAPTCTEHGWDAYVTCSRCDYTTYTEKTELGHDKVVHEAKAPTYDEVGWDEYVTCSRCDYTTYVELPALEGVLNVGDNGQRGRVAMFLVVIVTSIGLACVFNCIPQKHRR